jgi:hypothetical protein
MDDLILSGYDEFGRDALGIILAVTQVQLEKTRGSRAGSAARTIPADPHRRSPSGTARSAQVQRFIERLNTEVAAVGVEHTGSGFSPTRPHQGRHRPGRVEARPTPVRGGSHYPPAAGFVMLAAKAQPRAGPVR